MSFLKGLNRQETGPTAGEIRTVLCAIQRERSGLEALVARAEAAAGELQAAQSGDSAAMAAVLGERVATLEQQLRAIDALSPTLERAMQRLNSFDEAWSSAEARLAVGRGAHRAGHRDRQRPARAERAGSRGTAPDRCPPGTRRADHAEARGPGAAA